MRSLKKYKKIEKQKKKKINKWKIQIKNYLKNLQIKMVLK